MHNNHILIKTIDIYIKLVYNLQKRKGDELHVSKFE